MTARRLLNHFILAVALLVIAAGSAEAQQGARLAVSDTLWEVHLAAGEEYVGRVVAVEGETITLQTTTGTRIQFTRAQAVTVRPAQGELRGSAFWREDPNNTRLFFSPTARTLEAGDGYFGVYELFIPFVAYGITDWLMIAGGSPFYLGITGEITPPIYLGPKVRVYDSEGFDVAAGALGVFIFDDDETEAFSLLYGAGTLGSEDRAVTLGAGWGYVDDGFSEKPVVMLGGETRVGRFTKLLTENLFVPGERGVIISGGVRFFGQRLSADVGLAGMVGDDGACCFPLVNVVYNFGPDR